MSGTEIAIGKGFFVFFFPKTNETKTFMLSAFANGFLAVDSPDYAAIMEKYQAVIKTDLNAYNSLESAKKALAPYEEYLD